MLGVGVAGIVATLGAQSPGLTIAQREAVDRGELVVTMQERAESHWPAVTVYVFIDATPEAAAAVFTDYQRHATYIPSVTRSHVSRVIDPATVEVDYTLAVPIVSDEEYTVRDRITRDSAGRYRVDWTLVRASTTKGTVGHALFASYTNARSGRVGTLLEYYNFVTPGSRLAGLGFIKNQSVGRVRETARAVARQVELERGNDALMQKRLARLHAAIAAAP